MTNDDQIRVLGELSTKKIAPIPKINPKPKPKQRSCKNISTIIRKK